MVIDGKFERLTDFMGAFGIYSNRSANFLIEDGKAVFPLLTDRGKEFIQYMNRLYTEGLVSPEFLVDKEAMQKMISGNGFMMSMNWVEIVRQMDAFHEKNPGGKLEYIAPPVGKNGEQGHLSQTLVNTTWIVPKTSEDKTYDCVAFLEKCNADEEIVNRICLGEEGVHYQKDGGEIKTLPAFADITYKGYYSRVILDSKWDDYANKLEGFDDPIAFAEQYKKTNEIFYAPFDIPASGSSNAQLQQTILDGVMEMIVKGYSDEKFEELKAKFDAENGNKILEEYQEWYDAQS